MRNFCGLLLARALAHIGSAHLAARVDLANGAFVRAGAGGDDALAVLGQRQQVGLVHKIQEMDVLIALIVPVDDEIKGIAALGRHGDELLACAESGADVVHKRQVALRGQGRGASGSGVILQQYLQKSRSIRVVLTASRRGVENLKVFAVYIAGLLRHDYLVPAVAFLQHLHLRAVEQMPNHRVIRAGAGAQVQIGADVDHRSGLLPFGGKCPAPIPDGHGMASVRVFGHNHGQCLSVWGLLTGIRVLRLCGCSWAFHGRVAHC